jgi:hypothetical protein
MRAKILDHLRWKRSATDLIVCSSPGQSGDVGWGKWQEFASHTLNPKENVDEGKNNREKDRRSALS